MRVVALISLITPTTLPPVPRVRLRLRGMQTARMRHGRRHPNITGTRRGLHEWRMTREVLRVARELLLGRCVPIGRYG